MKTKKHYAKILLLRRMRNTKTVALLGMLLLTFVMLSGQVLGQQTNKIQKAIDAIKTANDNENDDYVTDGQRTVWVKSYKRWVPSDFTVIRKEAPDILNFLSQAVQRNRYDVLEQLLPDYYRKHGGVKAFAADVLKQQGAITASIKTKAP